MKRIQLTIRPDDTAVHPVYDLITGGADYLSSVELINWNVTDEPIGLLHRIQGDRAAFAADLDEIPQVVEYTTTPVNSDSFYIYIRDTSTPIANQLFDMFAHGSLIVIPPAKYNTDGTFTGTVIGSATELQAAIERVPFGIGATIERIGGPDVSQTAVTARLSDRQHEAIVAGIEMGYYSIPRQATHADVAAAMDSAPSTVSEHLRKAEAKIITGLFSGSTERSARRL